MSAPAPSLTESIGTGSADSQTFTVYYCYDHDQGSLVEGEHGSQPDAVRPCGDACNCHPRRHGQIDIINGVAVPRGYTSGRYCRADWRPEHFLHEVYSPGGQYIDPPPAALVALLSPEAAAK